MFVPIVIFGVVALMTTGFWFMFDKAGQPGWAILVPFYNLHVMTKIAKLPGYYTALAFVPVINLYALWQIYTRVGKNFGKGTGFGFGMVFLTPIFVGILGFGDSEYVTEMRPPQLPRKVG